MGRVRSSIPRSRLPLHRRLLADPAVFRRWLLVVALAFLTSGLTGHLLDGASDARHRWGQTRPVLVVSQPVATGALLAGSVRTERWPLALLPDGPLGSLPAAARAAGPMAAGSPVTRAALRRSGATGSDPTAAGRQRVAVPAGTVRLPLTRGDRVDVWATVDPTLSSGRLTTHRVAEAAVVTSASARSVVVAVHTGEVPQLAEAAALATITLVATG